MGDADITLRHIVRRHPEALVQAFAPEGRVEILGWLDTEVTTRERRLDKALGLRVDGERRALEVEFEYELDPKRMGLRVYEYQAMFTLGRVMADVDPWGYTLREEIAAMLETQGRDLIVVSQTLREAFERGIARGRQEGIEKMLRRLFMRRLGRALSEREQQALSVRASTQDPEAVEDRALTLEGEALASWLLDPSTK